MEKIKILPVYPKFPLTFWSFESSVRYLGKKSIMPPTGLATVAAMLPRERFDVQNIVDLNVEPLTDEQIRAADLIFTSTMVVQEQSHNEVIERAHRLGKRVVAGGPFPTSYPERNNADVIVSGEAETTLNPFLEDLLNGTPKRIYTEQSVGVTQKPGLERTPVPRWDLLDLKKYSSASIQYSRGCPFNCEFCDITNLFGRNPRTKTPSQMTAELDALIERNYKGTVFVLDDNIIGNAKNLREFLPALIAWQEKNGHPFKLFTEASMNLAWDSNKDILEDMVRAGFDEVFLGIETADPETARSMNKSQNAVIPPLEAVKRIQRAGIEVTGGFIVGSDADKESVFEDLFRFIQEAGIVVPMPGLLTAMKGTNLYNRLEKEGRLRSESKGDNTHHLAFNFEPKLDEKFLIDGYVNLLSRLFEPKNYYDRCRTLQNTLGKNRLPSNIGTAEISAFFRSMSKQIFAPGGLEYAKLLGSTALTRPRDIPGVVRHAIKLDHLQKITRASSSVHEYHAKTEGLYERFRKYTERMLQEHPGSVREKIGGYASKVIKSAEKKLSSIHRDFRDDAKNALENLRTRVREEVEKLNARYSPA